MKTPTHHRRNQVLSPASECAYEYIDTGSRLSSFPSAHACAYAARVGAHVYTSIRTHTTHAHVVFVPMHHKYAYVRGCTCVRLRVGSVLSRKQARPAHTAMPVPSLYLRVVRGAGIQCATFFSLK